jgi:alpha-glucan,water dikinase
VGGDEEIPDGVVACVTPEAPDVLSHVSVRARNCEVLFATCYDPAQLAALEQMADQMVQVSLPFLSLTRSELV